MGHLVVEPLIAADDADIGLDAEGPRAVGGFDRTGIGAGVLRERGDGDEDGRAGDRPEKLAHVGIPLAVPVTSAGARERSEEHTSELQSLMRISYAVFCLKKKNNR